MIALDPQARFPWVLYDEKHLPTEQQTTFFLRDLTLGEQNAIEEEEFTRVEMTAAGVIQQRITPHHHRTAEKVLRACWVDVENLRDETGALVKFEAEATPSVVLGRDCKAPTARLLAMVPSEYRIELANIVRARARLGGQDRKNLLMPQPAPSATSSTTAAPA